MDFSISKEQTDYRDRVFAFAQGELGSGVTAADRACEFPRGDWMRCAEFGIQGLSLPAKYNGREDVDFMTAILAMEALGRGCPDNGLTFALNAQMWTVQLPLLQLLL